MRNPLISSSFSMNQKGSAYGLMTTAILIVVVLYVAVAALGRMHSSSTYGCTTDENGTVHNCTLSDNAFKAINSTGSGALDTIEVASYLPYAMVALAFGALFVSWVKGG